MEYKKVSEKKFNDFIKENSLHKFIEKNRADKLELIIYKDSNDIALAKYFIDPNTKDTFGFSIKRKEKNGDSKKSKRTSK